MRLPLLLLLLPLLTLSHAQPQYPIPPPDAPYALVHLRIEGPTSTLFSSPVTTSAHNVTTPSSGTHICDGTNLHAHPSPGPTLTGALDSSGTPWDGTWYPPFEDFLITRVAGVPNTDTAYWGLLRNWRFAGVGGCQQRVGTGDELLVAWDAFSPGRLFLRAEVSRRAVGVGELVQVRVWDGVSGRLVGGAAVGGAVTGADGTVEVAFEERGVKRLKAEKEGCTRSNEVAKSITTKYNT